MDKLIAWVEIPAKDMEKTVNFYNQVLGLNLEIQDFGSEKMACFPSGEGAISQAPGFEPGSVGVLVSLDAGKDLDGALQRVRDAGGEILTEKTAIEAEGRGYFAIFKDLEGNKLGLYGD